MVVWLRSGAGACLGVKEGVIPREQVERILSLDAAEEELASVRRACLADAQRQAEQLVNQAHQRANELLQVAGEQACQMRQEGFDEGLRQALSEWHVHEAERQSRLRSTHEQMRERLAQMVVEAVRQLVQAEPTEALIRGALERLDRFAKDAHRLTLTVHPADVEAAHGAARQLTAMWSGYATVTVQEDAQLSPGSCHCESDAGWVDASLDVQLQAVERAARIALASVDDVGRSATHG